MRVRPLRSSLSDKKREVKGIPSEFCEETRMLILFVFLPATEMRSGVSGGQKALSLFHPNMRSGSRGFLLSLSIVESLSLAYSVMPWMILFENFTLVSSMWRRRSAESKLRLSDTMFGGHVCVCGTIASLPPPG